MKGRRIDSRRLTRGAGNRMPGIGFRVRLIGQRGRFRTRERGRAGGAGWWGVVVGSDGKGEAVEQDVVFDHEKLDAYRVARELVGLTSGFLKRNISRDLRDQLDRSSTSILFNIAEGAGKTARADKQRFYEIARGSATETAAQLDVLHIRGVITGDQYRSARLLLLRTVQMLSRLAGGPRAT